MAFDGILFLAIAGTALVSALATLGLRPLVLRLGALGRADAPAPEMVFLFEGEQLVDATPEARRFLSAGRADLSDWQRFSALVRPDFPTFADRIAQLPDEHDILLTASDPAAQLSARWLDGVTRIQLRLPKDTSPDCLPDLQSLSAMTAELATLREVVEATPTPAWQQDENGAVTWANSAYLGLVRSQLPENAPLSWPLPALLSPPPEDEAARHREVLHIDDDEERWFDCLSVKAGSTRFHFALPADAAVRAETALRNFVQTLTKTFAELPIGLAVFNRARELVLFNPAMSDLFNLEPEFLTARPTLVNVLDRLRETRMMPEPKDYRSWREQIVRLERDAADGVFSDTWTLPGGQVYRVTGRPHPDGAVAFLFEDISAEMSLTRRFRGEIETGQAVIDNLDEAIAVFSSAGILTMSNAAYSRLWGEDPGQVMGPLDVAEATALWQKNALPEETGTTVEMSRHIRQRKAWTGTLVHADGRRLACRLCPIGGGAVLAGFRADHLDCSGDRQVSRAAG